MRLLGKQIAITSTLQVADEHFTRSVETESAKSLQTVVIARLDFMSLMIRGSNFQGFKETTTTGTLLTRNGGTYPRHCICIWFIHKFMYSYAELSSSDLHSIMMTLNYCTSPIASSCHSTEPGGLWKNSQNRSRICFAEAVIELCILEFFS